MLVRSQLPGEPCRPAARFHARKYSSGNRIESITATEDTSSSRRQPLIGRPTSLAAVGHPWSGTHQRNESYAIWCRCRDPTFGSGGAAAPARVELKRWVADTVRVPHRVRAWTPAAPQLLGRRRTERPRIRRSRTTLLTPRPELTAKTPDRDSKPRDRRRSSGAGSRTRSPGDSRCGKATGIPRPPLPFGIPDGTAPTDDWTNKHSPASTPRSSTHPTPTPQHANSARCSLAIVSRLHRRNPRLPLAPPPFIIPGISTQMPRTSPCSMQPDERSLHPHRTHSPPPPHHDHVHHTLDNAPHIRTTNTQRRHNTY